jgi:BirA family biotin operon repressor/biotin-[acetyl-CoA-carboxylase] ligase
VIPNTLTEDRILPLLRDHRIGWSVHAYGSIGSTNDTAKILADSGAPEGTLVVAETQTSGHGRRGNVWESPPGGLWFSFVVRPHLPPERASGLSVVTAVAVAKSVIDLGVAGARIKWPNDVFVSGRKLSGVMVRSAGEGALVIGVGVNANIEADELPAPEWYEATSLLRETGELHDRARLLAGLLGEFERRYFAYRGPDHASLIAEWRELSLVVGEWVTATVGDETVQGTVFDMEDDCGLVLRLAGGGHRKLLPTGDVTLSVGNP